MKHTISFIKDDVAYYATVYIFWDGNWDVIDFYTFDDNMNSIDLDWHPFKDEIELLIN